MWILTCSNDHEKKVGSPTELEEILEFPTCEICSQKYIEVDPDIPIGCPCCYHTEYHGIEDAHGMLGEQCYACKVGGVFRVVGSQIYNSEEYHFPLESIDGSKYLRHGREDCWDLLAHFTTHDKFQKILLEGKIKASLSGLFKCNVVNLTETPPKFGRKIRERFGNWGIVFRKEQIVKAGGMPSIYIPKQRIKEFDISDKLKPFANVISLDSKYHNFLHEREWRIDKDIDFNIIRPLGLIKVFGTIYSDEVLKIIEKFDDIHYD